MSRAVKKEHIYAEKAHLNASMGQTNLNYHKRIILLLKILVLAHAIDINTTILAINIHHLSSLLFSAHSYSSPTKLTRKINIDDTLCKRNEINR